MASRKKRDVCVRTCWRQAYVPRCKKYNGKDRFGVFRVAAVHSGQVHCRAQHPGSCPSHGSYSNPSVLLETDQPDAPQAPSPYTVCCQQASLGHKSKDSVPPPHPLFLLKQENTTQGPLPGCGNSPFLLPPWVSQQRTVPFNRIQMNWKAIFTQTTCIWCSKQVYSETPKLGSNHDVSQ